MFAVIYSKWICASTLFVQQNKVRK